LPLPSGRGRPYAPACDLAHDAVSRLLRALWDRRGESPSLGDVQTWGQYTKLPEALLKGWGFLVEAAVSHMLADLKGFAEHEYVVSEGRIGYKEQDGIAFNVRYGYKTMFAYLCEEAKGRVAAEATQKSLKLLVNCGTFLFAKFPGRFDLVSGVTGTLETLGEAERALIRGEYRVGKFVYLPSAYGPKRLQERAVVVTDGAGHAAAVCKAVEEGLPGRASLVFFDSRGALERFWHGPAFNDLAARRGIKAEGADLLVEETPPAKKQQIVSIRAAARGAVTLATRPFGRGTDFLSTDASVNGAGGVHVVQTFLSETESEEIQIKGRTARQGDNGSYALVLSLDDVAAAFKVGPEELEAIRRAAATGDGATAGPLLQAQRARLFDGRFSKLRAFVERGAKGDKEAWGFVDDLAAGRAEPVRAHVQRENAGVRVARILVLVDATGSMQASAPPLVAFRRCRTRSRLSL
jgi:hypothetical protein